MLLVVGVMRLNFIKVIKKIMAKDNKSLESMLEPLGALIVVGHVTGELFIYPKQKLNS